MSDFSKPYSAKEHEERIYGKWLESGYFTPENLPNAEKREPFTIIMPPPNANGHLHAGHALFITLEDIITRYQRMRGKKALWVPGADHAGFETQIVYERELEKQGRSRFGMDPQELYKEILAFTLKNKVYMENEVRAMGASCDWSREKFTLDTDIVQKTQETFKQMYDDGLIYRGSRIINWCPKHQTSLSDVETEFKEQTDPLYYITYGPFTITTARPETKFGDKYVVMHPDDERYKEYHEGQQLEVEWINGTITATVIKDSVIDMSFGTGVMTITPWHDTIDFEIAERHALEKEQIIDWRGRLLPIAEEFAEMKIGDARAKIIEKLKEKGLLVKTEEAYRHNVKVCYKCATPIEPQVKDQWFVSMKPLAKLAIKAVDEEKITFVPDNYRKVFLYWMEHTLDWNISRQIIWGIPIPAKLCENCATGLPDLDNSVTSCPNCGGLVRQDTDTFDTWFSSGQWPYLALGYPDHSDFHTYYPTQVMETGHDLIFRWVPRMVIFGLYRAKNIPFGTVYMHGLIHDAHGKKMSKSKGNVINPLELSQKYGTDALRMALIVGNTPGTDMALSEDKIKGYKHFANKIWNASRFVLTSIESADLSHEPKLTPSDAEALAELHRVAEEITNDMEQFRFYLAAEKTYHYFWHTFADTILEGAKVRLHEEDAMDKLSIQWTLHTILTTSLKLLHPFMPFVTEAVWEQVPQKNKTLLMIEPWPHS